MIRFDHGFGLMLPVFLLAALPVFGQIDPYQRDLLQVGYNVAFEGHAPMAGYAFYYHNQPGFLRTNLTLRLAVAPTYLDSELGISGALGPNTDVGIGLAGGAFADSFAEIREGQFLPGESFVGYGCETSASVYHLFNPGRQIPLYGLVRVAVRGSFYDRDNDTEKTFELPPNRATFAVRAGLRWGGREPTLYPDLAMELSIWYEGEFRSDYGVYGFADREVKPSTHAFLAEAMLAYQMPELKHAFSIDLTAGTAPVADRFSAFRLGAVLPFISQFPLSIPGYYYQEITASSFALLSGNYLIPLEEKARWNIDFTAAGAVVDYLPGMEQPGNWHSGVGAGIFYKNATWRVMLGYGYGFEAIRTGGRGANALGILVQLDWDRAVEAFRSPLSAGKWRGWQRIFNVFSK